MAPRDPAAMPDPPPGASPPRWPAPPGAKRPGVPAPPGAPRSGSSGRSTLTLLGACVGVPAAVAILAGLAALGLSCGDNAAQIIRAVAIGSAALGTSYALVRRSRRWLIAACAVGAGAVGTIAGTVTWYFLAFMKCWNF